jgi:hypothetical protein
MGIHCILHPRTLTHVKQRHADVPRSQTWRSIPHSSTYVSITQALSAIHTENGKINCLHFEDFFSVI